MWNTKEKKSLNQCALMKRQGNTPVLHLSFETPVVKQ